MIMKLQIIILVLAVSPLCSLERVPFNEVDLGKYMGETQNRAVIGVKTMVTLVLPRSFWEISLANKVAVDGLAKTQVLDFFKDKIMIGIVIMKSDPMVGFVFDNPEQLRKNLTVTTISPDGQSGLLSICGDPDSLKMQVELSQFMGRQMGELGNNMCFTIVRQSDPEKRLFDEYTDGTLKIQTGDHCVLYRGPFESLYKPRMLPNGMAASASWKYDPWSGQKLIE